jgi:cytochrome c oxidase assembly protein subunit 15
MASLGITLPLWRSLAPRLAKDLFTCRQCLHNQGVAAKSIRRFGAMPSRQPTKAQSTLLNNKNRQFFTSSIQRSAAAQAAAEVIQGGADGAKRSFPKISDKAVAYWLLGSAASVFGIVVFGGLTRLTESGCVCVVWDAKRTSDADGQILV